MLRWVYINPIIGTQSSMGPRWTGRYSCQFEKHLPEPEIKCSRPIHLEIRVNLAWCFIGSSIFLFEQTLSHYMTLLFYHIWLKTVSKGTWTEEVRNASAPGGINRLHLPKYQKKWISNIGGQIIVIYIWKIDGNGYICLEKQAFFDNDLCRLRVISHLYWWSNSEIFVDVCFPWTKITISACT